MLGFPTTLQFSFFNQIMSFLMYRIEWIEHVQWIITCTLQNELVTDEKGTEMVTES